MKATRLLLLLHLLSQSTIMFRIIILMQSPSSIKLSSCIRNQMILNVVGAIHNYFQGMRPFMLMSPHTIIFWLFLRICLTSVLGFRDRLQMVLRSNFHSPPAMIIFILDSPLKTCMLLFLCQHWSIIEQSTLVTHSF